MSDLEGELTGRRERLERVLQQLYALHSGHDSSSSSSSSSPAQNDWPPLPNDVEDQREVRDFILTFNRLRNQNPNTPSEILRSMAQNQLERERDFRQRYASRVQMADNLRSAAMHQAVRRIPRISARSNREHFSDRYREYNASRTSVDHAMQTDQWDQASPEELQHTSSRRSRRTVASDISEATNDLLEIALKYLARLRSSTAYDDGVSFAMNAGYTYKDLVSDDFILDVRSIPTPAPTSLLSPGAMFSGMQHANQQLQPNDTTTTQSAMDILSRPPTSSTSNPHPGPPTGYVPWRSQPGTYSSLAGTSFSGSASTRNTTFPTLNRWPVKVTVFSVNYETMSLTASMEAYDVPAHPSNGVSPFRCNPASHPQSKSITTYLEGEILDFRRHTFLTESFHNDVACDVAYWRKLAPFKNVPVAELPQRLLSRTFLAQVMEKYILMRWKERCFVRSKQDRANGAEGELGPEDDGCGLTISGFYYVCLRREDGLIEGLYCDAQSSPYQYLKLARVRDGGFPAWDFA
jgi:hypothetical protein